ncbi:hypothetical protein P154DRAFT_249426 [Amniculicola lignicola CBS 123094]|uniref:Uncharacterized protein n=1 Tax=Amniculicola lignicola CBS 123094 TaxID=1392246 RepID=A0A6A5WDX3_9PLEO|nr:hypothetical protein P154DRAFT_249426 [Amniculicola lignicola CBS 123094]
MYEQGSSPSVDLSRTRLRQLAHWIRDDIDPVVAQEGHDKLRPDDVIALHEFFQALRYSNTVTTLDLRATGIHRAVMDVAGLATRWPGRLVNECDQLLDVWTARFGPLGELYPFIYDRGGRLEGIASPLQHSKDALLKRWRETYPEKIATKKSRRHGSLGFKAGHWWLNPLFAHHAGIIDLESTDGGVCCDDHGAYAVLLKDTGEVEASAENSLTYCCAHSDRGRFRLTAATPKSRQPIRILRSHNLNSIWGPKAGVRYEGL